jgi:hypothetical protein
MSGSLVLVASGFLGKAQCEAAAGVVDKFFEIFFRRRDDWRSASSHLKS